MASPKNISQNSTTGKLNFSDAKNFVPKKLTRPKKSKRGTGVTAPVAATPTTSGQPIGLLLVLTKAQ